MSRFQKATRKKARARVALVGPSGSGKTYTALVLARGLVGPEGRIAVIDTERGSASKYAGTVADFDALDMEKHDPREYVDAIRDAAREGYEALVIDSLSHAWNGRGGALELVDQASARTRGNSFAAWRDVTPLHNALIDAILAYPGHVIATMRAKTEYVLEEDARGKKTPRKIGLAPVQRDGMEYEFDVVADIDHEHRFIVTKSRCPELADAVIAKPGADVADALRAWLDDGDTPARPQEAPRVDDGAFAAALDDTPVSRAIAALRATQGESDYLVWAHDHVPTFGRLSAEDRRRVGKAMVEEGHRHGLAPDDVRALCDEIKASAHGEAAHG